MKKRYALTAALLLGVALAVSACGGETAGIGDLEEDGSTLVAVLPGALDSAPAQEKEAGEGEFRFELTEAAADELKNQMEASEKEGQAFWITPVRC